MEGFGEFGFLCGKKYFSEAVFRRGVIFAHAFSRRPLTVLAAAKREWEREALKSTL
jgi:hypothetical protein